MLEVAYMTAGAAMACLAMAPVDFVSRREIRRLRAGLNSRNTPTPDLLDFAANRLVLKGDSEMVDFVQALRREAERQRETLAGKWPGDGMNWYFNDDLSTAEYVAAKKREGV